MESAHHLIKWLKRQGLTAQQIRVVLLVCEGLSNREISTRLRITYVGVRFHINRIFKALDCKDRTQVIVLCWGISPHLQFYKKIGKENREAAKSKGPISWEHFKYRSQFLNSLPIGKIGRMD